MHLPYDNSYNDYQWICRPMTLFNSEYYINSYKQLCLEKERKFTLLYLGVYILLHGVLLYTLPYTDTKQVTRWYNKIWSSELFSVTENENSEIAWKITGVFSCLEINFLFLYRLPAFKLIKWCHNYLRYNSTPDGQHFAQA